MRCRLPHPLYALFKYPFGHPIKLDFTPRRGGSRPSGVALLLLIPLFASRTSRLSETLVTMRLSCVLFLAVAAVSTTSVVGQGIPQKCNTRGRCPMLTRQEIESANAACQQQQIDCCDRECAKPRCNSVRSCSRSFGDALGVSTVECRRNFQIPSDKWNACCRSCCRQNAGPCVTH